MRYTMCVKSMKKNSKLPTLRTRKEREMQVEKKTFVFFRNTNMLYSINLYYIIDLYYSYCVVVNTFFQFINL
jgi:hypothetical protein